MDNFTRFLIELLPKPETEEKEDFLILRFIAKKSIPEKLKCYAPPNFPELYFNFMHEFTKFTQYKTMNSLVGKNIVVLAGAFNSGKTSFLNNLLQTNLLPHSTTANATIPTYILQGNQESYLAIGVFGNSISLAPSEFETIRQTLQTNYQKNIQQLLCHTIITTPNHPFEHLAFLDTPGYALPNNPNFNENTDSQKTLAQLNSADIVLWFVDAKEQGISRADLLLLKNLRPQSKLLILINKTDRLEPADILPLKNLIAEKLASEKIVHQGILAVSSQAPQAFENPQLLKNLHRLNKYQYQQSFNDNFLEFFHACLNFYQTQQASLRKKIQKLKYILRLSEDLTVQQELQALIAEKENSLLAIINQQTYCEKLQKVFFQRLRIAAISFGLYLPELNNLDPVQTKLSQDILNILQEYKRLTPSQTDTSSLEFKQLIQENLTNIYNKFALQHLGNSLYVHYLFEELFIKRPMDVNYLDQQLRLGNFSEYAKEFSGLVRKVFRGTNDEL